MLDVLDLYHYFEKYGPWGLLLGLLVILRKNRKLKRYINAHLPEALQSSGDSELCEIKHDVKEIKRHLGLEGGEWVADSLTVTTKSSVKKNEMLFTSHLREFITARSAKPFINLNIRRMNMDRLKSRKLWITIISAVLLVLKEGFDIPVDSETVLAFAGIVITAIFAIAHVDAAQAKGAANNGVTPADPTGE